MLHAKLASLRLSEENAEYAGLITRVTKSGAEVYWLMNKSIAARQLSLTIAFNTAANSLLARLRPGIYRGYPRIAADRHWVRLSERSFGSQAVSISPQQF